MRRSLQLLWLLYAIQGASPASPPVNVSLKSSWPAPPPFIEILETVALETPDAFFPILDKVTDQNVLPSPHKLSFEALHQAMLEIMSADGYLNEPGALATVEMNLALHAATPKIQAFYNHYLDHHNNSKGTECGSWVDWYGEVVCNIEELAKFAGVETIDPTEKSSAFSSFPTPRLLTFDHVYPPPAQTLKRPPRTAIFYASPTSTNFRELHDYLLSLAFKRNPQIEYVFRHIPPKDFEENVRNYLSGYGVALSLKKTDYLVVDDRNMRDTNGQDGARKVDNEEGKLDLILTLIHDHPENATAPGHNIPLTADEFSTIGFQATQLIVGSPEPLSTLNRLTQNFPKYAASLARRVSLDVKVQAEALTNNLRIHPGQHVFWINGAVASDADINPFGLLRLLKKERNVMLSLVSLGLNRPEALQLLTHPSLATLQSDGDVLDDLYDATDRPEGGDVVVYWNDIEEDADYENWSSSLQALLRPVYRGVPSVRLNLFNVIHVLDLSQMTTLNFITGVMSNILDRKFPLRFGFVPILETEEGVRMAKLFYHLTHNYGSRKTLGFLQKVAEAQPDRQTIVDWEILERLYTEFADVESSETHMTAPLDEVIDVKTTSSPPLEKVKMYAERLGATLSEAPLGHFFFNGKHFNFDDDFLQHMQTEYARHMQFLQEQVYQNKIDESQSEMMATYFYDQPTTGLRRSRYINPTGESGSIRVFNLPDLFARTRFRTLPSSFVYPQETSVIPLTLFVIADFDSPAGLQLLNEAFLSIKPNSHTRISFIHNPLNEPVQTQRPVASWLLTHLINTHVLSKTSHRNLLRALSLDVTPDESQKVLTQDDAIKAITKGIKVADFNATLHEEYVSSCRLITKEVGLLPGQQALFVNGRVVGPIEPLDFHVADFEALESYGIRKSSEPVMKALEEIAPSLAQSDRATYADLISMVTSIVVAMQQRDPSEFSLLKTAPQPRQKRYELVDSEYTGFTVGDSLTALYHVVVIMDPLSVTGQKWSSLLQWISNMPDMFIKVILHPTQRNDMPLKSFYRYNLLSSPSFDENGQEVPSQVVFKDLPTEPIYTLAMDVPSSWLVRPREALYDLDNIQLDTLSPGDNSIDAVFALDYLVIEGHAREVHNHGPPRGLQIELLSGGEKPSAIDDTQVVANLGYFQFKAKPGTFGLEMRMGRGRDIYDMESVGNEGWNSPTVEESGNEITLTSFEGLTLYPRFRRKPGMEKADVLAEPTANGNSLFEDLTSRVTSFFKSKDSSTEIDAKEQSEINIFTVASGLLYERFVSIMILSVLRNTKSTVKFWFIENFLSPSFLEFIPHLAQKYNFKYELITYKWPSWLREQTEKQRIIWAYKILFLDVLFPMDLKKVIFVDADQIVRADLQELVDLDLQGAPYGYTPMGDDNTEMEGFRFWKTGYWKEFLQGQSYHISALYVIDLVRFRQMAAGDILRGHYQALSADPNSLANLDQDLPNNLQREVPIFSLHEDWLWCETWCSQDRLHRAKTIDLCQNPLTKEPKLSRARKIPEWEEYDTEIANFTRELAGAGVIHSGMATADTNVLANTGTVSQGSEETPDDKPCSPDGCQTVPNDPDVPVRDEL